MTMLHREFIWAPRICRSVDRGETYTSLAMNWRSVTLRVLFVGLMGASVAGAQPSPYPPINMPASPLFPADNWWNVDVCVAGAGGVCTVIADPVQTTNFTTFLAAWAAAHLG